MAFFDDLGKKLSQAGQSVVQKTQDMTEISRLNSAINEAEKLINATYLQIGKLYIAMHAKDHEPDFEGMVKTVCEAEARIHECREQICQIKGMVKCEKCGTYVESSVAFCSTCGSAMPRRVLDDTTIRCSHCGQLVPKDVRFCTSCGKPTVDLTQAAPVAQPVAPAAPAAQPVTPAAPQPAPEAPAARFCTECGAPCEPGSAFCVECGAKLQ